MRSSRVHDMNGPALAHPFAVGFLVYLAALLLSALLFDLDPTACVDGWLSPSIGAQGAFSHHGGVAGWKAAFAFWGSAGAGLLAGLARHRRRSGVHGR